MKTIVSGDRKVWVIRERKALWKCQYLFLITRIISQLFYKLTYLLYILDSREVSK